MHGLLSIILPACSVQVITQRTAYGSQAHAKSVDNAIDKLVDQTSLGWPLHHTDLENSTLFKALAEMSHGTPHLRLPFSSSHALLSSRRSWFPSVHSKHAVPHSRFFIPCAQPSMQQLDKLVADLAWQGSRGEAAEEIKAAAVRIQTAVALLTSAVETQEKAIEMQKRRPSLPKHLQKIPAAEVKANDAADMLTEMTGTASVDALEAAARALEKAEGEEDDEESDYLLPQTDSSPPRNVWGEFATLGRSIPGIVNLGQGFPDYNPPDFVIDAARNAVDKRELHQYARTPGHLELVELLAQRYSGHFGRAVDPVSEVAITLGASEGLFLSMRTILSQAKQEYPDADEFVFFDPYFNLYEGQLRDLGGRAVVVPLEVREIGETREWQIDWEVFRDVVGTKTAAIILNSPQNPTGKIFRQRELEQIADVVRQFPNIRVISDEVYKYILHPEDQTLKHVHFAGLPEMWDRTLTVSSAGKTFGVTGWTLGWVVGPKQLMAPIHKTLPNLHFCAPMPLQQAMVEVLQRAEQPFDPLTMDHSSAPASHDTESKPTYYSYLQQFYREKKEKLTKALRAAGLESLPADAGMFLLADVTSLWPVVPEAYKNKPDHAELAQDWIICRWLAEHKGILSLPASPFMQTPIVDSETGERKMFARFCFAKTDETLDAACDRLEHLFQDVQQRGSLPKSGAKSPSVQVPSVVLEEIEELPVLSKSGKASVELISQRYPTSRSIAAAAVLLGSGVVLALLLLYGTSNAGQEPLLIVPNSV
eukprot:gnl/MRDRNA2_/MRDRNA2_114794_c0_seq1.p1 gnl/MRDRNA2_/MRDRNA2_114794_c0~~gnl/MRDRNA2_/MRDRNA2_114794_c0_seq1.p1  ORF type:complete len:763 (-),score=150.02 gnl/MRDRNA2_/MRDRNA2_114794_c0_seq1:157-2445(-)